MANQDKLVIPKHPSLSLSLSDSLTHSLTVSLWVLMPRQPLQFGSLLSCLLANASNIYCHDAVLMCPVSMPRNNSAAIYKDRCRPIPCKRGNRRSTFRLLAHELAPLPSVVSHSS